MTATIPKARRRWTVLGGAALVFALLVTGCGAAEPTAVPSASATPSASQPADLLSPTPSADVDGADVDGADVDGAGGDAGGYAGTPIEFFFRNGDVIGVIGVAHDDVLNVRSGPGVGASVVDTLGPLSDDVVATGSARQLPRSIWVELGTGDTTGWANARYLAYRGETTDITSEVVADLGEDRVADTMLALGRSVARTRASVDPPSDIVVVAEPTAGDLGEIAVDVIGLGDDAAVGVRLVIFGQPIDTDAGFDLKAVEETVLCGRGVSRDGRCV